MESNSRAIELISISRNLDKQPELMRPRGQVDAKQKLTLLLKNGNNGATTKLNKEGNSYV